MVPQSLSELEDHRKFLENRAKFPLDELARRAGRWIAWGPDGSRIVAEANDAEALDRLVLEAGEGPERCITEGIPADDSIIGGVAVETGLDAGPRGRPSVLRRPAPR
jgi:hypothetical protein